MILGAYTYNSYTGRAYIFYGGESMNNIQDITMTGESTNNVFGSFVSTAGDVNGDGYSDVIVGAPKYGSDIGRAYVLYGGAKMNNIADVTITGEITENFFGYSVSTAGDVNSDGYSDVIVGAYGNDTSPGRAYIFYGEASMNNILDVILTGEAIDNKFGYSVSTAEDVNGDGYSDVIVGAPKYNSRTGRAYIFYGGESMDNVADITMTGETTSIYFGWSVSTAKDVNGDQNPDVIIGAKQYNTLTGRAYLYMNLMPKPELVSPISNSINNPVTINFKWKKLNTAIYYMLYISIDASFNNIVVNDTIFIDTSRTVSGLQKNTKYFWRVRAKDTLGVTNNSSVWSFTTIPPIKINLKVLMEGMYYPLFNQMSRRDTVNVILRDVFPPYAIRDSARDVIDSITFTGLFTFNNLPSGTYYIVIRHFNCIETWSKAGGESLVEGSSIYNYDFTSSNTQAYGYNLIQKGNKYCIYSGNVNQDNIIDAGDLSLVDNAVYNSITGRVSEDVTGDNFVDASDMSIVDNNVFNSVIKITP